MKPQYTEPLPQCEGPKLKPFHDLKAPVVFDRLISDINAEGNCAHVFEVSIGSMKYALKVFNFYNIWEDKITLVPDEQECIPDDLLEAHCDPFYAECRAYGRLEEKNLNGKVAARCYGYMTISYKQEDLLSRKFGIDYWERPGEDFDVPKPERQPLRAIVKELILKDVPLTGRVADRILRDMKRMRRCGVYSADVRPRNYKNGLLVDMSEAITEPYYLSIIRPGKGTRMYMNRELYMWETMVKENQLNTILRAVRNKEYCEKLRPRKTKAKRMKR